MEISIDIIALAFSLIRPPKCTAPNRNVSEEAKEHEEEKVHEDWRVLLYSNTIKAKDVLCEIEI